jgi:hypothetical protein
MKIFDQNCQKEDFATTKTPKTMIFNYKNYQKRLTLDLKLDSRQKKHKKDDF